ncbi:MAG: hypothetical protein QOK10_3622 [Pseudonocardiales bacterium]|nr:hypothetical protein [Pseudonocardiales bacterium]
MAFDVGESRDPVIASVRVRSADLARGRDSLEALLQWVDRDGTVRSWAPLRNSAHDDEYLVLTSEPMETVSECRPFMLLLLRWSSTGWVEWKDPQIANVARQNPRRIRLAAASSRPTSQDATMRDNQQRFLELCKQAAEAGADLLCLPENILAQGMPELRGQRLLQSAVEIPSEHIQPFVEAARRYNMAIGFSVLERAGELVHNTAVLIDAQGSFALKYRKVHLAIREAWRGVTPGDGFSVTELQPVGARVGMNICMDSSSAESARVVASLGAEILLLPIENDYRATQWDRDAGRSKPFSLPRWCVIQRARAMDNHLYVAAARIGGVGTGIFAPDGEILAMDYGESPLVMADIDLDDLRRHPTGPPYRDVIWFQRRDIAYGELAGSKTRP